MDFVHRINELKKYLRSDENKKNCIPFISECQRIEEMAKQDNNYMLIYKQMCNKIIREEFSVGGESIHRGCYCPSPVLDVIVGNLNRGKLLKRLTVKSKPTYRFGFDCNNNLIIADYRSGNSREIIIRKNDTEKGIVFTEDGIKSFSECSYIDNQIRSYARFLYNPFEKKVQNYRLENYKYTMEGLTEVDWFDFMNSPKEPLLKHEKYHFTHDK